VDQPYPPPPPPAPPPPAPPPPPPGSVPSRVPLALIAGLGFVCVTQILITLMFVWMRSGEGRYDHVLRWQLLSLGCYFAFLGMAVTGATDLARRAIGGASVGARVVLTAVIAMLLISLSEQVLLHIYLRSTENYETGQTIWKWLNRAEALAWAALAVGIAVAGSRVRTVRLLAAPLIIATLLAHPFDFYPGFLGKLLDRSSTTGAVVSIVLDLIAAGLAIVTLWLSPPEPELDGGWDRAASALDRTASSLYARLWIAVSGALLVMMLFGSRGGGGGEGLAKLWAVGIPLASAIAGIVMVTGIFGASGLTAPRAPRLRLLFAGAALTVTVAISSVQVFSLLDMVFGDRNDFGGSGMELAGAMPLLLPLIGTVGLAVLAWGLHGIADAVGSQQLQDQAGRTIAIVIVCNLVGIGLPYAIASSEQAEAGDVIFGLLLAAAASVITLLSLAKLCRNLAVALRARHEPVASYFG
jgi:hypothetical protein